MNFFRRPGSTRKIRAFTLAALLVALILLALTRFAFVTLLKGPTDVNLASELTEGAYVSADISIDLGIYAEKYSTSSGEASDRYILVPMGEMLVSVLLPERYFDSEAEIRSDTYDWINGKADSINRYILTIGTVRTLEEKEQTILYDWFSLNNEWMSEAGLVGEVGDFTNHLSEYVICVDEIGGMSAAWVYALSSVAWLLIVLALVCAIITTRHGGAEKYSVDMEWINQTIDREEGLSPDSGEELENKEI